MTKPENTHVQITCVLAAGLAMGCPSMQDEAQARESLARTEATQAVGDARDDAFEERAEFVAQMEVELAKAEKELDALVAEVQAKADAKTETKTQAEAKLKAAREKHAKISKELARAKSATQSTWTEVKSRFQTSYDDLRSSIDKARQTVGDEIEPT